MKPRSIGHVFLNVVIAANCSAFAQTTDARSVLAAEAFPQIPLPSGSYGVGRIGYDWVEPRADRYSSAPNVHRELMVYFWYTVSVSSANTKGVYLPGAQRMDALPQIQIVQYDPSLREAIF